MGMTLALATAARAEVTFYTDMAQWQSAATGLQMGTSDFATTAANVALADQVGAAPALDADLGSRLTFPATATGLPASFELQSLQPGATFIFDEMRDGYVNWLGPDYLSVGRIGSYNNDDWQITLTSQGIYGLLCKVGNNVWTSGDVLRVYDPQGTLIGSLAPTTYVDNDSMGVISSMPIGRVVMDKSNSRSDNIYLTGFTFAVPEPGSLSLLACAASALLMRRRGRRE